jgi:hypothetical protein
MIVVRELHDLYGPDSDTLTQIVKEHGIADASFVPSSLKNKVVKFLGDHSYHYDEASAEALIAQILEKK